MSKKVIEWIRISDFIQNKRNELNLTQDQLSELLGITKTAVSNWERGSSMIDVKYIVPLANVFSVKVDDILFPAFDSQKDGFYYPTELFQKMINGQSEINGICNKLIELYIQCKTDLVNLIHEYKQNPREEILQNIKIKNKFGFSLLSGYGSMSKYDIDKFNVKYGAENCIETSWILNPPDILDEKSDKPSKLICAFYLTIFNENMRKLIDNSDLPGYYYTCGFRAKMMEFIFLNCTSSLFVKYIRTFSQEYRSYMLTEMFDISKELKEPWAKKILKLFLRADCKYIDKNGEDQTIEVYKKIM